MMVVEEIEVLVVETVLMVAYIVGDAYLGGSSASSCSSNSRSFRISSRRSIRGSSSSFDCGDALIHLLQERQQPPLSRLIPY